MSITFHPYVYDATRSLWVFPDAVRAALDDFEMNVSNSNGADLLLALGLDPDASFDPMTIEAFAGLVTAALRRHLGARSPALEPFTDAQEGRMTFTFCGRREGYLEERLGDLAKLIQKSRGAGATHFGWG
jgi:hypothetical protein